VIKECIVGAIESRFGTSPKVEHHKTNGLSGNRLVNGNGHTLAHSNGYRPEDLADCCGDGLCESTAPLVNGNGKHHVNGIGNVNGKTHAENFEEFIYRVWGRGIAKHFAIPYNRKLWAVPLTEMETSWLGGRVPMPDLEEMIEGALKPVPKPMGPNARFGYPLRGGFQALMDGFRPFVEDRLRLGARVIAVSPVERTIQLSDGTAISYDHLISTMPLPLLIRSMGESVPQNVRDAAAGLRYVSVRCVHIGVGRENLTEKHWIYYPEDPVFHRIFVQGNASPHCNPPGGFGLTCEITYSEHKPLPCDGDALIERCVDDCQKVGIFNAEDPIWAATQVDLPFAYVVYDHDRPKNVKLIRDWLAKQDVILAGRYSEWEYYNSDHAFIAGKKAAEGVLELKTKRFTTSQLIAPNITAACFAAENVNSEG
jgi:UDP-galactopyranose mutase